MIIFRCNRRHDNCPKIICLSGMEGRGHAGQSVYCVKSQGEMKKNDTRYIRLYYFETQSKCSRCMSLLNL